MQSNVDDEHENRRLDLQLDKELEDTFPASDALTINRRRTDRWNRSKRSNTRRQDWDLPKRY